MVPFQCYVSFLLLWPSEAAFEVFSAVCRSLVLPCDTVSMGTAARWVPLTIAKPRIGNRSGARSQYSRITLPLVVVFLEAVFAQRGRSEALWPASSGTLGRRWGLVSQRSGILPGIFTPGGVRGGGALWCPFTYNNIESLPWQMRLVGRQTLSHCLQGTAAARDFARPSDSTVTSLRLFHRCLTIVWSEPLLSWS
jgi:hypothetical protein